MKTIRLKINDLKSWDYLSKLVLLSSIAYDSSFLLCSHFHAQCGWRSRGSNICKVEEKFNTLVESADQF